MAVKYLCWIERTNEFPLEEVDQHIREMAAEEGFTLQPEASEYWRREGKRGVELSAEQFPGSRPIWLWQAL